MENASKALIIAGSILIAILLITMIVFFGNKMSSYFAAKHDEKMIEQNIEFNNRFENYNGQTIRGNEVISLLNRVIDYNNYSVDIENYERVEISIDLKGHQNEFAFEGRNNFFGTKIANTSNDANIREIAELGTTLLERLRMAVGNSNLQDINLQKLSSEISNIVVTNFSTNDWTEQKIKNYKDNRKRKLKNILGLSETQLANLDNSALLNEIIKITKDYYVYTQFKRAMFKVTEVNYSEKYERVNDIKIEVVLENGTVKFN